METKLKLITSIARKDKKCKFNNIAYLLNVENLTECFYMLKKDKAVGIDGISPKEYEKKLTTNLEELVGRMKRQSYKPQPVKRVYIPKVNGRERPLGIPAVEDKIVQMGVTRILVAIYEEDFLEFSYGFRPNRSCHDALDRIDKIIMKRPVNHVIEADIKGFFDNVDHDWMMRSLKERISDTNFLRIIKRFLISGLVESGNYQKTEQGTPQGGILSPVLANIYLHYVLDLWFEITEKQETEGYIEMVRYADDFVIFVQYKGEAERVLEELKERLSKFNLQLSEEKTKITEFGRYAVQNARKRGKKAETFDFLGITHFCDKSRKGNFKVGRKTARKKFITKVKEINLWLKSVRNLAKPREWWQTLCAKLRGHYQYYGVSGNYKGINRFYVLTVKLLFKWLNRRSQNKSFNWERFKEYLSRHPLPTPRIYHNFYTLYGY